jgi:cytochrome c biogenesis protein CcdA
MVGTIIYVVNVDRDQGKSADVFWLHLGGYLVGAAVTGGLLGAVGGLLMLLTPVRLSGVHLLVVIGAVAVLYSLREAGLFRIPAPNTFRQVPAKWRLQLSARWLALAYGLELGAGLTTHAAVTTFYVAVCWVLLVGDPVVGAVGMTAYGLGRGLPIFLIGRARTTNDDRSRLFDVLVNWKPVVHFVNGLALGFIGACVLVAGLFGGGGR